jgi:hypothetical protein
VLLTLPLPVAALATVSVNVGVNVAVTLVFAFIVTTQVLVPVHAPVQPVKTKPAAALAASVTCWLLGARCRQRAARLGAQQGQTEDEGLREGATRRAMTRCRAIAYDGAPPGWCRLPDAVPGTSQHGESREEVEGQPDHMGIFRLRNDSPICPYRRWGSWSHICARGIPGGAPRQPGGVGS